MYFCVELKIVDTMLRQIVFEIDNLEHDLPSRSNFCIIIVS